MPFLEKLHQVIKAAGTVTLATNESFYADEAEVYVPKSGFFKLESKNTYTSKDIGCAELPNPRSHFEKKYLERGETIHNLVFSKA